MRPHDAVAALRPRPCGPPLRGRAPLRDGITDTRLTGLDDMAYRAAGSTLKSPIRGRRLGAGAPVNAGKQSFLFDLAAAGEYNRVDAYTGWLRFDCADGQAYSSAANATVYHSCPKRRLVA